MPTLLLALTVASAALVPTMSFARAAGCGSALTDGGTVCGGGAAGNGPAGTTGAVPAEPASAPAGLLPQSTVGNPIDLMTGNKRQAENDFALPGAALVFNRTYNSLNSDHDVGLGHGWHHSYAVTLLDAGGGARELIQGDGRRLRFAPAGTDDEGRPLLRGGTASEGTLIVLADENEHEWRLGDGRRLRFRGSFLVEIDWPDQRHLSMFYRQRRLASVTDETGRRLAFEYAPGRKGLPSYERRRFGPQPGTLARVVLPDGRTIGYDYDERYNLTRVRHPDGTSREYHYEASEAGWPHRLTGLTDRTGERIATWGYDEYGRAILSERAGGVERVRLVHPDPQTVERGEEVVTRVTNSLDRESMYRWQRPRPEERPRLLAATGSGCASCPPTGYRYDYDGQGRLTAATKTRLGTAVGNDAREYLHDALGRLLAIHRRTADGTRSLVERREYLGSALQPHTRVYPSVNPDGMVRVQIERNVHGAPIRITERGWAPWVALPGERLPDDVVGSESSAYRATISVTHMTYEERRLVAIDGPRPGTEDTTRLEWDGASRLVAIRAPLSPPIRFEDFDTMGRPRQVRSGTARPIRIDYDESGRVVAMGPVGEQMRFRHDREGRPIGYNDADGRLVTLERDRAGRPTTLTDAFGRTVRREFDSESRELERSTVGIDGSLVSALAIFRDASGRVERIRERRRASHEDEMHHRESRFERDDGGELIGAIDPYGGARVELETAALNRIEALSTGDGDRTEYLFDARDRVTGLVDARGSRTVHHRDDRGRIVGVVSAATGVERYERDAAGQVVRRVREDTGVTTYRRDAAGRAVERRSGTGELTRWKHDPSNGRLVEAISGSVVERFRYDDQARLTTHVREIDGHRFETSYRRDGRGRVVRKGLPDGQVLHYRYHERGSGAGTLASVRRSGPFGLGTERVLDDIDVERRDGRSGWTAHNGLRTELRFDPAGRIESLRTETVMDRRYRLDASGRILSIEDGGESAHYRYASGRLIGANTADGQYRYRYDALGNRLRYQAMRRDGTRLDRRYRYAGAANGAGTSNRLAATHDAISGERESWRHDAGGSVIARGALRQEYDAERRLRRVYRAGSLLAEYRYNAFGERVSKRIAEPTDAAGLTTTTYFLYDEHVLSAEADAAGRISAQYVYLEAIRPVVKLEGRRLYAIHGDHQGTPVQMTGKNGRVVWEARHEPFGVTEVIRDVVAMPLRAPGQYSDAETGTYYNYYRDYDPETGRYLSSDPIGLAGGENTYLYALADPIGMADPLGLIVYLMNRDLNGPPIGTHMFIVMIPDKPGDFENVKYNVGGKPVELETLANGQRGFVIGAQAIRDPSSNRLFLEVEAFNDADLAAANEYFAGQGSAPLPPSMGGELSEWNPHLTQCNGSGDDTADIAALLTSAENFSVNTDRQRIPYPGILQQPAEAQGYVNSNSWALSYLEYASITPVRTNVPGYDALAGNRIDPDYFTADPALADLTLENTDTDGDGILDVQDPEPLIPNRRPPPPQGP